MCRQDHWGICAATNFRVYAIRVLHHRETREPSSMVHRNNELPLGTLVTLTRHLTAEILSVSPLRIRYDNQEIALE